MTLFGQPMHEVGVVLLSANDGADDPGGRVKAVRVTENLQPPTAVGRRRIAQPAQALGVVAERGDVLQRVGHVVQPRCRAGEVPVDDSHRLVALPHDIPRAEVPMADDLVVAGLPAPVDQVAPGGAEKPAQASW